MGKIISLVAVVLLVVGVASVSTIFNKESIYSGEVIEDKTNPANFVPIPALGQKIYRSLIFKFWLIYPDNLSVKEFNKGDTTTIVFEDLEREEYFQIFVVPYNGSEISKERLAMDLPSGVIKDEIGVFINGVKGISFTSQDVKIGETREIWFINKGFLYEITVPLALDSWLSLILQNWYFMKI